MKLRARILGKSLALVTLTAMTLSGCTQGNNATSSQTASSITEAVSNDRETFDSYTTSNVKPLRSIKTDELDLVKPGVLTVATLSNVPPTMFIDETGTFTGFDLELIRAMAEKLGLNVEFLATDFISLLPQVANHTYDVGASSIVTTDLRRQKVDFTNGYDYGINAPVTKAGSGISSIRELSDKQRVGVVQASVQDEYATRVLGLEPVRFSDVNTLYQNLIGGQIDVWFAPVTIAKGTIKEGDGLVIGEALQNTVNFVAFAVTPEHDALVDALNSALDAVIADGTWSTLNEQWFNGRELPGDWKPGSKAVTVGKASP